MFDDKSENALPSGCRVEGTTRSPVVVDANSHMAIYGPDDGASPLFLILARADGNIVRLAEFESFADAFRFANGGKNFDPSQEEGGIQP